MGREGECCVIDNSLDSALVSVVVSTPSCVSSGGGSLDPLLTVHILLSDEPCT